jgi:hypothetical protein
MPLPKESALVIKWFVTGVSAICNRGWPACMTNYVQVDRDRFRMKKSPRWSVRPLKPNPGMALTGPSGQWPRILNCHGPPCIGFGKPLDCSLTVSAILSCPQTCSLLRKSETSLDSTSILRTKRWCCVWTKRARYKRLTVLSRVFLWDWGTSKGLLPITSGMVLPLYLLRWTSLMVKYLPPARTDTAIRNTYSSSNKSMLACHLIWQSIWS